MRQRPPLIPARPTRDRRLARGVAAAGIATALAATGGAPALAQGGTAEQQPDRPAVDKPLDEKVSTADLHRLDEARAQGAENVTLLIAAEPGETDGVASAVEETAGGSVGYREDQVGYVRATVPTPEAETALERAAALSSVLAIDLNEEIEVPDPTVDGSRPLSDDGSGYPAPDETTPAANPYQPSHEIGAVDWVADNPAADGRGVTIGVLDTGVDLDHPALQETTTGEPKIVDSVTATDPLVDGDGTWLSMTEEVSGEVFEFNDREYTAPDGEYRIALFEESVTAQGEMEGDLDRDGSTDGSWAVLYDPEASTVTVDLDDDGDFRNETPMEPYRENQDYAHFGEHDPDAEQSEAVPFVVEIRENLPLDPMGGEALGNTADFVNIGVVSGAHGTHVAGIAAANGLFGGEMDGAAPGADVVSSRACVFGGGCTASALTEGMIDLVINRDVDLINMSIGGLPALNDGNNARTHLYNELIETFGVQIVISAGNSGPGANTVGDPSVADRVLSIGASVSDETWAANYGSEVERANNLFPFSSRGPRADGGFKPDLVAPGASINAVPTWQPGQGVPEAGYDLPAGYGMLNGTSMAAPQAAGGAALLLSAGEQRGVDISPAGLRGALLASATQVDGLQAHEQGAGQMDTAAAWQELEQAVAPYAYTVQAPVNHELSEYLETPDHGAGVYDRETGPAPGESKTYDVQITRTSGPQHNVFHRVSLEQNAEETFSLVGGETLELPLNEPVTVQVTAEPAATGMHSAALTLSDFRTTGESFRTLVTVVTPEELDGEDFAFTAESAVERNDPEPYYVRVPEGAETLEIALGGLATDSQTRWLTIDPSGVPLDEQAVFSCYQNFEDDRNECRPDLRSYSDPTPGVYELVVDSRRTSPTSENPFTLTATALGASFDPAEQVIEEAEPGTSVPVSWDVANGLAAVSGTLHGGELGSAATDKPSIADGERTEVSTVDIGPDVETFEAVIGSPSDAAADLDLFVLRDGAPVANSATGGSEERVVLTDPEPGTYTVEVDAYSVPDGTTEYDYRDVLHGPELGTVEVGEDAPVELEHGGELTVEAEVTVTGDPVDGREFVGGVELRTERGTTAGTGVVRVLGLS